MLSMPPGHGLSEGNFLNIPYYAALIGEFIKKHGPFDSIVGHSMGAFSAVYALHGNPDLHSGKLVALASPGEAKEFFDHYKKVLSLSARAEKAIINHFMKKISHGPEYFSLPKLASALAIPGLIIHDKEDREAPFRHALAANKTWKNSTLVATSGLGHNLKSDELIEEVLQFVGQVTNQPEPIVTQS